MGMTQERSWPTSDRSRAIGGRSRRRVRGPSAKHRPLPTTRRTSDGVPSASATAPLPPRAGVQRDPIWNRHPSILGSVQAPTLVMWRAAGDWGAGDQQAFPVPRRRIPGAKYVELPGSEYSASRREHGRVPGRPSKGSSIRSAPSKRRVDRVLATVLFTDIVGSTERAAGARRRRVEGAARASPRDGAGDDRTLPGRGDRYDGRWVPRDVRRSRARCAVRTGDRGAVRPLGLEIRAGLHTGEVEMIDGKVGGLAVHIGARVGALAGTVRGPRLADREGPGRRDPASSFEDAGEHELKGVPDRWHLYRVVSMTEIPSIQYTKRRRRDDRLPGERGAVG